MLPVGHSILKYLVVPWEVPFVKKAIKQNWDLNFPFKKINKSKFIVIVKLPSNYCTHLEGFI